jgi:AIPR protein
MAAGGSYSPDFSDLQTEVKLLRDEFPKLPDDDLFVIWFMFAFVAGSKSDASASLTGPSSEKGIDALHIDHQAKLVTVVQGKLRKKPMTSSEPRAEVISFATIARQLAGKEEDFANLCEGMEGGALAKVKRAREAILKRDYRLNLHYATLGKCSYTLSEEASRIVRGVDIPAEQRPRLSVLDGNQVLAVLADYLDGVAPPVPMIELRVDNPQEQFDRKTGVSSWIFSANGWQMGQLVEQYGVKLFARNIRGYLGETGINKEIRKTLHSEPSNFWYLNNGITIVCDAALLESASGRDRLSLSNPQIINGQQTTYALSSEPRGAQRAEVSVRVISIAKDGKADDFAAYDAMVSRIVEATNSQNKIKAADLRSNDRRQVSLERDFHQLGYHYQRKRAARSMVAAAARRHEWRIKKEDLARAIVACDDSAVVRRGADALFEEPNYRRVFRDPPRQLLCRWWLWRAVESDARGVSDRQWAKYVVLRFLWTHLGADIRRRQPTFISLSERSGVEADYAHLQRAIGYAFRGALSFYRQERGTGAERAELPTFFKRQDLDERFERFWKSADNPYRERYEKAAKRFVAVLGS